MHGADNYWSDIATGSVARYGDRSRKQNKVRWSDEIGKFAGIKRDQLAQDRVTWSSVGEVFDPPSGHQDGLMV